jgi:N-dimethylarginine dimethylaminohydrolase
MYFPEPDINIPCEDYWGINGGSVIPTHHGFIVSEFAARSNHQSELMSASFKELLGIGIYIVPSSRLYVDIDHKMNYVPWRNVLVIDEAYRQENKDALARMLDNFDVVLSYEPFGPNFVVCEATRKIVTYAADCLTDSLRNKGIEVITVPDACTKDIADDAGVHCATNSFHDVGILEYMFGTDWFFDETKF